MRRVPPFVFLLAISILFTPLSLSAPPHQQPSGDQGMATGGARPMILDSNSSPITAGGFVDTGPRIFEDITKAAALSSWSHKMGTPEKSFIIETVRSGVGLIDYDIDGWRDIYFVNGSIYDAVKGKTESPHAALFHNNHDGIFTDVARKAGATNDRWGFGVAVADFDNDGWPDLYVTNFGKNRLSANNHDGTFTDVAEKAGVTLGNWSTGATFQIQSLWVIRLSSGRLLRVSPAVPLPSE